MPLGNYCFYFCSPGCPLYLTQSRGFSITEMTLLATLGYAVQAAAALTLGHFSDRWTRSGRCRSRVPSLDDGRKPVARRGCILGLAFAHNAVRHRPPSVLRRSGVGVTVAQSLCRGPDVRRPASCRDMDRGAERAGQSVGYYRADRHRHFGRPLGLRQRLLLTAAIAAFGGIWWAFGFRASSS